MSNFKLFVLHVVKQTLLFGVLFWILLGGGEMIMFILYSSEEGN